MENDDKQTPEFEQDENKNEEGQDENQDQKPDESESKEDDKDWKAEALKYKAILDRNKDKFKEAPTKKTKSDGLDYGQKAYLKASGISGESETKLVEQYMSETGKTLEQVLDSKFFKAELEEMREISRTKDATPESKRSGNVPTDSVDYWMTKPIEEVPQEMRIKVVNKKLEQSKSKGVFYNS